MYATSLSEHKLPGAPVYRPYWPEAKKKAAADAWISYLGKNRGRLMELIQESDPYPWRRQQWSAVVNDKN
jgi:hypothetical protein